MRGRSFPEGSEGRPAREGDLVSALPTTSGISSTLSGSSPRCLLDVRLVLWGLKEAIFANNSLLNACVMSEWYLSFFLALSVMNTFFRELCADDD